MDTNEQDTNTTHKHYVELNEAENKLILGAVSIAMGAAIHDTDAIIGGGQKFREAYNELGPQGMGAFAVKMQQHALHLGADYLAGNPILVDDAKVVS